MWRAITALTFMLLLPAGCASAARPAPEAQTISARAEAQQVDLLAMGDWGTGGDTQKRVAFAMANYVREADAPFHGVLLAGDNFYMTLSGIHDPQWQTVFEQMYDPQVLDFPFFVSLGNHDYDDGKVAIELEYARENPHSRWKLPSPWYRVDFPQDQPLVTVLMLDSNRDLMPREHWHAQNMWLRDQLRERDRLGEWVVCVAHHPLFSNGDHGDVGPLQRLWGTAFEEYGVDFYVCGHDHDLQHLEMPPRRTSFVLCGGGGAGVRPMRGDRRGPFSRSINGFVHLRFTPEETTVRYLDRNNNVVHAFSRDREGVVKVIESTGRDRAKPRSVRSITRPDLSTAPAPAPSTVTTR